MRPSTPRAQALPLKRIGIALWAALLLTLGLAGGSTLPAQGHRTAMSAITARRRWRRLADQRVQWVRDNADGSETYFEVPPETTFWQRLALRLIGPFVPVSDL